jgi:signal transduction histidine kinase
VKKEFKRGEFKLNDNITDYFPAHKKVILEERIHQALLGETFDYESSYPQEDGNTNWYHVRLFPVKGEGLEIFGLITAITNITEKKNLEQKILNQKVQEQKSITRAVLHAQESERNKIGQELHDNVNQILVGAKMYMGLLRKGGEQTEELLKKSESLLDNGINEIRSLTREQVTPVRGIDLKDMIQALVKNLEEHSPVKTDFIYDIQKVEMDDDMKLNIYRIVQVCLNNIIKHAEARFVSILLFTDPAGIHTVVSDDGKGFDPAKTTGKGIGINNILNRAESYNGKVSIESGPGKGCRVEVTIPL